MFKRTVTYTDFNGLERTEDVYFHLSKSELIKMELGREGRMTNALDRIVKAKDVPELMKEFEFFIRAAYGERTPDGRGFKKSKELSDAFANTIPYDIIFTEIITDDNKAAEFINKLIPADLAKEVAESPEYKALRSGTETNESVEMTVLK